MTMGNVKLEGSTVRLALIDDAADPVRFGYSDEDVADLVASIRSVGVLQPVLVRASGDRFELIAGHRRVRAARLAGLDVIPAVVTSAGSDASVVLALSENLNRADMNVMEEAVTFGRWLEKTGSKVADLARLLGRSDSYVLKRLALLELDGKCIDSLVRGEVSLHHALELKRVEDVSTREYLLNLVVKNGASVAVLSGWVDSYRREGSAVPGPDLGQPYQGHGPSVALPTVLCRFCGRDTGQTMLHAVMVCSECDTQLRAAEGPEGSRRGA